MSRAKRDLQAALAARATRRARQQQARAAQADRRAGQPPRKARVAQRSWSIALRPPRGSLLSSRAALTLAVVASGGAVAALLAWLAQSVFVWPALVLAGTAACALVVLQRRRQQAGAGSAFVPDDALCALDELTSTAASLLPQQAIAELDVLRGQLRGLCRELHLQGLGFDLVPAEDAATIALILRRHLPDCLRHFLAVPAPARGSVDAAQLLGQLTQLRDQLAAIEARVIAQRRQALALHGRFLELGGRASK